jgi:hypothetical protein
VKRCLVVGDSNASGVAAVSVYPGMLGPVDIEDAQPII